MKNGFLFNACKGKTADGGHGIGNIIFSGHVETYRKICVALNLEFDTDKFMVIYRLYTGCCKISRLFQRIGVDLTRGIFYELRCVICVKIYDTGFGLLKYTALEEFILFEILMFIRSDVVGLNICEYAVIKGDGIDSVELEGLRRSFHNHITASLIHHIPEIMLEVIGLGSGVFCRYMFSAILHTCCTDASGFFSG